MFAKLVGFIEVRGLELHDAPCSIPHEPAASALSSFQQQGAQDSSDSRNGCGPAWRCFSPVSSRTRFQAPGSKLHYTAACWLRVARATRHGDGAAAPSRKS